MARRDDEDDDELELPDEVLFALVEGEDGEVEVHTRNDLKPAEVLELLAPVSKDLVIDAATEALRDRPRRRPRATHRRS